jgi:hypothetical protein
VVFESVSLWRLILQHCQEAGVDGPTCTIRLESLVVCTIRLKSLVVDRYGEAPIRETNALTGRSENGVSTSYDAIEERNQE